MTYPPNLGDTINLVFAQAKKVKYIMQSVVLIAASYTIIIDIILHALSYRSTKGRLLLGNKGTVDRVLFT